MTYLFLFIILLSSTAVSFIANSFLLIRQQPLLLLLLIPVFVVIILPVAVWLLKVKKQKHRICCHGTVLLCAFYISVIVSLLCQLRLAIRLLPLDFPVFLSSLLFCIGIHLVVFWVGIICVYLTSTQLGIKMRLVGLICGMIPLINLIVLSFILHTTVTESILEIRKASVDRKRQPLQVCATRYPLLLVHGVFFRDSEYFNYWGRIPEELEKNGARIFYGNHHSAASIADCAAELKDRIAEILEQTGAQKINIIAHSKGGLDCRYAISELGIEDQVASLTTINTPHRGCLFADYLLSKIPYSVQNKVADTYNAALRKFGDSNPDFLSAVRDLTDDTCQRLDKVLTVPEHIYCQSVGSILPRASDGQFPLNFSYHLVKHFSGENDGLVSEPSFRWGAQYTLLRPTGKRGISHGDMIDLNRQNIPGFDVREFYVQLVHGLKKRGL